MEKRLPDLPKSDSEFWQGEVNLIDSKKNVETHKCRHDFKMLDREIKCLKCGLGYFINVNDDIRDGHLYFNDEFVI